MNIIAPRAVRLTASPAEEGRLMVIYEEDFDDTDLVQRTINTMNALSPEDGSIMVSSPASNTIRIEMPSASLIQLANMMVGEFMQWGDLGQTRLCDMVSALAELSAQKA